MQVQYQYDKSDFRPLMRHSGYWRVLGSIVLLLGLSLAPSLAVLFAVGMRRAPAGGAVAFAFLVAALHWMLNRTMRSRFLDSANSHRLVLAEDCIEHESRGRWHRSNARWVTDIRVTPRYVIIRRGPQRALIPTRAFADRQQQDAFIEEFGRRAAAESPPPPPPREIQGTRGMSVEFRYNESELRDLAQQRFVPREGRGSALWLLAVIFGLLWLLSPELNRIDPRAWTPLPRIVGLLLALLLPVVVWTLMAPLRRRLNRLPNDIRSPQRVTLWSGGLEHSGEHFQSYLNWDCLTRVVDGRDFIVFYGDTGGWSAIPRRAFESWGQSQQFLEEATRRRQSDQDHEDEGELQPLPPHVETGNPYQSPGGDR